MQSMPGYYPQSFPPPSPYPSSGSPTTSSVMSASPAPIIATNLPPMQSQVHSMPATPATDNNKRRQVKNACTNCQKACKKCDDARPCPRCIKYGISDTCINSVRKERKKGIKRGPYKRRQRPVDKRAGVKVENGSSGNPTVNSNTNNPNNTNGNNDHNGNNASNQSNFSAAPAALPFGYPSNLNQYGQPYDPYNTYATYGKDQILPQSYVMSYPQVGYPVLVPATGDVTNTQQAYAQLSQQHLTGILTQRADSQQQFDQQTAYYQKTSGSPTMNSSEPSTTNTATNATSTATTAGATSTTTTSPATENIAPTATPEEQIITAVAAAVKAPMIKEEHTSEKDGMQIKKEESAGSNNVTEGGQGHGEKPQPITPMPSTSNSSGTSSPSDTHEEDQSSKFSGLTQLCSAALDQNKSPSS